MTAIDCFRYQTNLNDTLDERKFSQVTCKNKFELNVELAYYRTIKKQVYYWCVIYLCTHLATVNSFE